VAHVFACDNEQVCHRQLATTCLIMAVPTTTIFLLCMLLMMSFAVNDAFADETQDESASQYRYRCHLMCVCVCVVYLIPVSEFDFYRPGYDHTLSVVLLNCRKQRRFDQTNPVEQVCFAVD